jgi:GDP-L-fucose synthase
MYPANTNRKLTINDIGSEPLEPSNLSYAKAKIFSTRRVEDIARTTGLNWRVLVSSNLYGPFDHFDIKRGHLIASIIAKVYAAKQSMMGRVEMWGDGTPRREFTYAPEFADWVVNKVGDIDNFPYILNVGFGADFSVRQYYEMVISTLGLEIEVISRPDFPNGNMNKLMDSSMANSMGWNPVITPEIGIRKTLDWYEGNIIRE